jgi:hypothetical protein
MENKSDMGAAPVDKFVSIAERLQEVDERWMEIFECLCATNHCLYYLNVINSPKRLSFVNLEDLMKEPWELYHRLIVIKQQFMEPIRLAEENIYNSIFNQMFLNSINDLLLTERTKLIDLKIRVKAVALRICSRVGFNI